MQRVAAGAASSIIIVLALLALFLPGSPSRNGSAHRSRSTAVAEAVKGAVRSIEGHNPIASLPARIRTIATGEPARRPPDALPAGPGRCPDPRTCDVYGYLDGATATSAPRWTTDAGGRATIHYSINPIGVVSDLPVSKIVEAVQSAFATWHTAMPNLTFAYDGTTTRIARAGDGHDDIDFTQLQTNVELGNAVVRTSGKRIMEADMMLSVPHGSVGLAATTITGWSWTPCSQANGSCTTIRHCDTHILTIQKCYDDLQNVVTHEIGHWLWLADLHDAKAADETMYYSTDLGSARDPLDQRQKSTLSLGDVVGARTLYPCGCPLPAFYSP